MENFDYISWIVLPIVIFLARTADTTLGTIRTIMISKGRRNIVRLVGFFEVLIWIVAISQLMKHFTNVFSYLAWAGGFTMGSYLGFLIENKIALGQRMIRIITSLDPAAFFEALKEQNQGYTAVDGHGSKGPVKVIYVLVNRKNLPSILPIIDEHLPNTFFSVEEVVDTRAGIFSGVKRQDIDFSKLIFPAKLGK